jgi:carboxymethylenebutenolidase
MGFCMGGALTFASLASFKNWKSGSPFYGVPDLNTFKLENIHCKTLAHFG